MDLTPHFNRKLNQDLEEMQQLIKKQEDLLQKVNLTVVEKDKHSLSLETVVHKLIQYGISKTEILDITRMSSEQYEDIIAKNTYLQKPYIYLNEEEKNEYDKLVKDIQNSVDIYELTDQSKEKERIIFVHKVLRRYLSEYLVLRNSDEEDKYKKFANKLVKSRDGKNAYLSLVRTLGNEIKLKREELLIKATNELE
jgi:hypothetical protein